MGGKDWEYLVVTLRSNNSQERHMTQMRKKPLEALKQKRSIEERKEKIIK